VVFLTKPDDKNLDAKAVFDNLDNKQKRTLLTRFDHWIEGAEGATPQDKYFHGWPNDKDYKSCFVFKWNTKTDTIDCTDSCSIRNRIRVRIFASVFWPRTP